MTHTAGTRHMHQIRASAGSGKTYAITSTFLDLLAGAAMEAVPSSGCLTGSAVAGSAEAYHWQEVMAVTFTNRAAAEMRERILARLKLIALHRWQGPAPISPDKARRWVNVILERLNALNVRTIDSLLHTMVRLSALELRLPPDFEPVFDTSEVLHPLLDTLLEDARTDPRLSAMLTAACRELVFHSPDSKGFQAGGLLREAVMDLTLPLLQAGIPPLADARTLSARYAELVRGVRECAVDLARLISDEGLDAQKNLINALDVCRNLDAQAGVPGSVMLRKPCLDDCLKKASKDAASPAACAAYMALTEAVQRMEDDGRLLRAGLRLAPFVALSTLLASALRQYLETAGQTPQAMIPALAAEALEAGHGVSETFCRMGTALRHLLVDEFQDTSREQWHAMHPLVAEMLSRGGSLTWVGDVKQAIYGWRGGDATLFSAVADDPLLCRMVPEVSGEVLPMNRRSRAEVVAHNNRVFARLAEKPVAAAVLRSLLPAETPPDIFARACALLNDAFQGAAQDIAPEKDGGCVRLVFLYGELADDLNALVREQFFALMDELMQRRHPGEIAVLTRSNDQVELVATWLMEAGLPVVTENSFRLASHPLVSELVALLTFLNAPDNDLAFAELVCGTQLLGFGSVGDGRAESGIDFAAVQDWLATRRLDDGPLYARFQRDFPEVWERQLEPFHSRAGLSTPYDTVSEALDHFAVRSRLPDHMVFAQRFLEVLYEAENLGHASLPAFLDHWNAHGEEEMAPMPATLDAVRVMTVHKSKGLEFPVIVSPWLDLEPKAGTTPCLQPLPATASAPEELVLVRPATGMDIAYQSCADNAREALHRLYVAWTRAGDELYAFVTASKRKSKSETALRCLLDFPDGDCSGIEAPDPTDDEAPDGDDAENAAENTPEDIASPFTLEYGEPMVTRRPSATGEATPCPPPVAPECLPDSPSPDAADDQKDDEPWRPMQWLPRLKIFRSPLRALAFTPERRGTFVHLCLEHLRLTGNPEADALRALDRALATFPVPLAEPELAHADLLRCLTWYAGLPEAEHWMRYGTAEQSMLHADGSLGRADLLVDDGRTLTVVDYKTGALNPDHELQVRGYMNVLCRVQPLPVRGILVYVDLQEIREVQSVNEVSHA